MRAFVSTDEAAEMANTNQFFYIILECIAFVGGVAIVSMVSAVLGHVCIGRVRCFTKGLDEVGMEGFVKKTGSGDT